MIEIKTSLNKCLKQKSIEQEESFSPWTPSLPVTGPTVKMRDLSEPFAFLFVLTGWLVDEVS